MNFVKILIGIILTTNSIFELLDIISTWSAETGLSKSTAIALIFAFQMIGLYLLRSGLNGEYKGIKRIKMNFIIFLKNYFTKYSVFIEKYFHNKRPPYFIFVLWLLGAYHVTYLTELNNYLYGGAISSWVTVWLMWLFLSMPIGYISYVILGFIYHLAIRISGGAKDTLVSRNIILYAGIPIYVLALLIKMLEAFKYGNRYFFEEPNISLSILFLILMFIVSVYAVILSFKGARLIQGTKLPRSIIILLIIPITYYLFIYLGAISTYLADPLTANQLNNQAIGYMNMGNYDAAEESFKSAIENLNSDEDKDYLVTATINLATIYLKKGDIQSATDTYRKALKIMDSESNPEYYAVKGIVDIYELEIDRAISNFEKSLSINPDNQTSNNFLGLLYLGSFEAGKKDIEKALPYNKKSYELNTSDVGIVQNLALNYYELKEYDKSLLLFEKLDKMSSNNPIFKYYLGMNYFKINHLGDAQKYLAESVYLSPELLTDQVREILNYN